jgi:hypothetical protein
MGYLNGVDAWNPYNTRSYDNPGLDLWLEEYCKKHPADLLVNAAQEFYVMIGGRAPMTTDDSIWQHFPQYDPSRR